MELIARKMCLALAGILCWMGAMCQKENDTWYFGGRAGVSFSGGAAFGIPGGQMMQLEGAATISDGNGNLMMYTDGQSVWDRNHNVMPNGSGLLSGPSSAMAAVIVPQPCNQSRYYLFVVNDRTSGSMNPLSGLTYSIVDMSQNNGLGSIVSGQKNILLDPVSSEKVICARHDNGRDFWILHRSATALKAYLLSAAGLATSPVVSVLSPYNDNAPGTMKMSPNGNLIASCAYNFVELFDFNPANGTFSNRRAISDFFHYGTVDIEFSPDGNYLYWSYGSSLTGTKISQLNLNAGSPAAILASDSVIATTQPGETFTAMATGPDHKIYVCDWSLGTTGLDYLSVINAPNQAGSNCNFVRDAVPLSPGSYCLSGLTNRSLGRSPCVLTIQWRHFAVISAKGIRHLQWETAYESGNGTFLVERSPDACKWETIAEIALQRNSNGSGSYAFSDQDQIHSASYYRIARQEADGSVSHSEIRYVAAGNAPLLTLGPNPCDKMLQVWLNSDLNDAPKIVLRDLQGREIQHNSHVSSQGIALATKGLPAGQYSISIASPKGHAHKTFIVQHQ